MTWSRVAWHLWHRPVLAAIDFWLGAWVPLRNAAVGHPPHPYACPDRRCCRWEGMQVRPLVRPLLGRLLP